MKSKFISLIVAIAVVLAMVAVPGVVSEVGASGGVTIAVVDEDTGDATTYVVPGDSFTLDAVINNPEGQDIFIQEIHLDFDPDYFTVDSVSHGNVFVFSIAPPAIDNITGTVDWAPSMNVGDKTNAPRIVSARLSCTAKYQEGVSTVSWNYTSPPPRLTGVSYGPTDYLEKGNFSLMHNGTVIIGSPKLTVNVDPKDKGGVEANGKPLIMTDGSNVTEWKWNDPVELKAVDPAQGWEFKCWTGDAPGIGITTNLVMDSLTKSVTANFIEQDPILDVGTLKPDNKLSARFGDNTDSRTVTISNLGGHVLCWALGEPPIWTENDYWAWYNTYWDDPYGTPEPNTVQMVVTDASGDENYAASAIFDPAALRVINITTLIDPFWDHMNAQMLDATVLVDKCTLDIVQQDANLLVQMGENWIPANATVTWDFGDNCHGWPYYMYKQWSYEVATSLCVMGSPQPSEPPLTAWATVTGFIPDMPLETTADTFDCWVITHSLTPDPQVGAFMQTYWSDEARNFVITADGGTYVYPPQDIRSLVSYLVQAPAAPEPPEWLSFDKTHGALGIEGSEDLTVTANASGLNVTPPEEPYPFNFTISAPGNIPELVEGTFAVLTAETIDVTRTIMGTSVLGKPGETTELYPGETFEVYVDFDVPVPEVNLNAIGLTDLAPAGWVVEVNPEWCADPKPYAALATGNKAEYLWSGGTGEMPTGSNVSAMYKVTVPTTATPGVNSFATEDETDKAWLEYYFGLDGAYKSPILGNPEVTVTVPGDIVGLTRDVNHDDLSNVDVTIYRVTDGIVLIQYPNGVAEWSADQSKSGKFSVYLEAVTPGGASRIQLEVDPIAIADFSGASFFVREPEGIVHGGEFPGDWNIPYPYGDPYINILLDTNHDGVSDDKLEGIASTPSPPTVETWTEMVEAYGFYTSEDTICGLLSPCAAGMVLLDPPGHEVWRIPDTRFTLADWQAWFAENTIGVTVVGVQITFGWWLDDPVTGVYVDDVTINGITYDLEKSGEKSGKVALRGDSGISSPDYVDTAYVTGQYSVVASKARFYDIDIANMEHLAAKYIDLGDEYKLAEGATFNFSGDYGLVPKACAMSYAMKSVNLWVMATDLPDEWGLSFWKAKDSIHSWQFPS